MRKPNYKCVIKYNKIYDILFVISFFRWYNFHRNLILIEILENKNNINLKIDAEKEFIKGSINKLLIRQSQKDLQVKQIHFSSIN